MHSLLSFINQHKTFLLEQDGLDQLLDKVNTSIAQLPSVYVNQSTANALFSSVLHYGSVARNMFTFRGLAATPTRFKVLLTHLATVIHYQSQCINIKITPQKITFNETIIFNPRRNNQGRVCMMQMILKEIHLPSMTNLNQLLKNVKKDTLLDEKVKDGFYTYVSQYKDLSLVISKNNMCSFDQLQQLYLLSSSLNRFVEQYMVLPARRPRKRQSRKRKAKVSVGFFEALPLNLAHSYAACRSTRASSGAIQAKIKQQ